MSWALGVNDVAGGLRIADAFSRSQHAPAAGRRRVLRVIAAGRQARRAHPHSSPPPEDPKEAVVAQSVDAALVIKKEPQKPLVRTSYRRKKVGKDDSAGGLEHKDGGEFEDDSEMLPLTAVGVVLVDGYNVCGAWPKLQKHFRRGELEDARMKLLDACTPYGRANDVEVIVVFDSHVNGLGQESTMDLLGVEVVFSGKSTADAWIERKVTEITAMKKAHVTVVTSDNALQTAVYSKGGYVRSTSLFIQELKDLQKQEVDMNLSEAKYQQTSLADGLSSAAVEGLLMLRKQLAPNDPFYQKYIVPYDRLSSSSKKGSPQAPAVTAPESPSHKPRAQPDGAGPRHDPAPEPADPVAGPPPQRQVSLAPTLRVEVQGTPPGRGRGLSGAQAQGQAQGRQAVGGRATDGRAAGGKAASGASAREEAPVQRHMLLSAAPEETDIARLRRGHQETAHRAPRDAAQGAVPSPPRASGHDPRKLVKAERQAQARPSRKEPAKPLQAAPPLESRGVPVLPVVITQSKQRSPGKKGKGQRSAEERGGEDGELLELMRRDWEGSSGGAPVGVGDVRVRINGEEVEGAVVGDAEDCADKGRGVPGRSPHSESRAQSRDKQRRGTPGAEKGEEPCCRCSSTQAPAASRRGDPEHLCAQCRGELEQQGLTVKKSRQKQSLWEFSGSLGDHRSKAALQALKENLRKL